MLKNRTGKLNEELKHFARSISGVMDERLLSCYQLAKLCDIKSAGNVSNITDTGNCSMYNLIKLSKGLNIEISIKNGKVCIFEPDEAI